MWTVLAITPGAHHRDRRVVAAVTRCSAGSAARALGRFVALLGALLPACVLWAALVWVLAYFSQYFGVSNERALAAFVASLFAYPAALGLVAASLLVLLVSYARRGQWRTPRARWILSAVAAEPGVDCLDAVRGLLLSVVPPGDTVGLVADTSAHEAFRRLGFVPVRPESLVMIATMPPPADPAPAEPHSGLRSTT